MGMRLLWHWAILVLGLYLITFITPISFDAPRDLALAALVLIIVNTIIKPILIIFTLPLVLLSLGLFLLIINAFILYTVPHFVPGFHVPGFLSAFFGANAGSKLRRWAGRLKSETSFKTEGCTWTWSYGNGCGARCWWRGRPSGW